MSNPNEKFRVCAKNQKEKIGLSEIKILLGLSKWIYTFSISFKVIKLSINKWEKKGGQASPGKG